MGITIQEAENIVDNVRKRWVSLGRKPETLYMYDNHIKGAAQVAETIAVHVGGINPKQVYVSALLHDIAKIDESPESRLGRFHGILGYEMLLDKDPTVARACLLHEIPWNRMTKSVEKKFLGNQTDVDFVADYLANTSVTDEDLLIQLSDAMANKNGIITLEQRQEEYEARLNIKLPSELMVPYLELKQYFDDKIGGNVYELFPEINKGLSDNHTEKDEYGSRQYEMKNWGARSGER